MLHLHNKFLEEVRSYFPHLEIVGGLPKSNVINDDLLPKLLIMDDLMSEIFRDPQMADLFTRLSRHNSVSLVFTTQNYFDSGHSKTIVRQCNVQIIFENPMDKVLTRSIGNTIVPKQPDFLNNCFDSLRHFFPQEKFPYILIDGNSNKNMNGIMFRSRIFPDQANDIKPICFFVNSHYIKKR